MKYHCILIDLGHGWSDTLGNYDTGKISAQLVETQLIDQYSTSLMDEMDLEACRWELVPTRRRPGTRDGARFGDSLDGKLGLSCHMGWAQGDAELQSKVRFSLPEGKELAEKLEVVCAEWGQSKSKWFKSGGVEHDKTLPQHRLVVQLEPFTLNSPGAYQLSQHLDQLGFRLGKCASEWLKAQNPTQTGLRAMRPLEKNVPMLGQG